MNPTYTSRHGTIVDQEIEQQPLATCRPGADCIKELDKK